MREVEWPDLPQRLEVSKKGRSFMDPILLPDPVTFASAGINEKHFRTFVFTGEFPAVPLCISAEAQAEGIPDWDGPDYQFSLNPQFYYADNSCLNECYLCFAPGNHGWQRQSLYLRPRLPLKRITVTYFFEHKAGRVAYRDVRIEPVPARPEPERRILLLGDSNVITSYLDPAVRVEACLQALLAATVPGLLIEVENGGRSGESFQTLLEQKRYERDVLTLGCVDIAFLRYGANDRKIYGAAEFARLQREVIRRLRADFPGIRIVLETGTFLDYPAHYNTDVNAAMAPYHEATRALAPEADAVLDVYELMKRATAGGNWDLRYRSHPQWKLILDGRFDAEHNFAPDYYSNPHHTPPCNRLIARAEHDLIVSKKWLP